MAKKKRGRQRGIDLVTSRGMAHNLGTQLGMVAFSTTPREGLVSTSVWVDVLKRVKKLAPRWINVVSKAAAAEYRRQVRKFEKALKETIEGLAMALNIPIPPDAPAEGSIDAPVNG